MKNLWMTKMAMSFETPADGGGSATVANPPAPAGAGGAAPAAPAPAPAAKKGMFDRVMPASLKRLPGGSEDPNRTKTPPPAAKPAAAAATAAQPGETFNVLGDDGVTVLGNFKTKEEAQAFVDNGGKPVEKTAAPQPGDFNVIADDGKTILGSFKTKAEAQAFMDAQKGGAAATKPGAAPAAGADALPRPIMGRFKTASEVEEYIHQSGAHAQRLSAENKNLKEAHAKALADREAEVAGLKAEIETVRATPAAREYSKEELAELWKTDPAAAGEYLTDKKLRERDAAAAKEATAQRTRDRQEQLKKTNRDIEAHRAVMQKDAEQFPQFEDMAKLIPDLLDMTADERGETPLRGHVWAEELLYLAALGHSYRTSLKGEKHVTKGAMTIAARTAAAGASATAGPSGGGAGRGSGAASPAPGQESKGARIVKAAPRTRFFGGGSAKT